MVDFLHTQIMTKEITLGQSPQGKSLQRVVLIDFLHTQMVTKEITLGQSPQGKSLQRAVLTNLLNNSTLYRHNSLIRIYVVPI